MHIILFDSIDRDGFYPVSDTRALGELRMGVFTAQQRWQRVTGLPVYLGTLPYLSQKYPAPEAGDCWMIDARYLPDDAFLNAIRKLSVGDALTTAGTTIAARVEYRGEKWPDYNFAACRSVPYDSASSLRRLYDSVINNADVIRSDIRLLDQRHMMPELPGCVRTHQAADIFVHPTASLEHCFINASDGPVYIDENALVMDGAMLRGPLYIGAGAVVKMGAKIYGGTTIGPSCTVGGEIKNSIFLGNSNKAHDGYIGDSYIGEWCNLGAGTSCSNLKNTAGIIRQWSPEDGFVEVGNKCGVMMGDYSRTAINTSLNSGAVVGTCCNAVGTGLFPKYIPDFSWGTLGERYRWEQVVADLERWKAFKNAKLTSDDLSVLEYLYDKK